MNLYLFFILSHPRHSTYLHTIFNDFMVNYRFIFLSFISVFSQLYSCVRYRAYLVRQQENAEAKNCEGASRSEAAEGAAGEAAEEADEESEA